MEKLNYSYDGELVPYANESQMILSIINPPLHVAGDSQKFTPIAIRGRPAHTCAVLVNYIRLMNGQEPLSPYKDEFGNPINGFTSSMIAEVGYHTGPKQRVLFLKDSSSKEEINALKNSHRLRTLPSGASVSKLVRRLRTRRDGDGNDVSSKDA